MNRGEIKKKNQRLIIGTLSITSAIILISTSIAPSLFFNNTKSTKATEFEQIKWDITVPDDFENIHKAIEHAKKGDTIFVRSGKYDLLKNLIYWPLTIRKPDIKIYGEGAQTTVLDGKHMSTLVYIYADNVTISGFSLKNNGINSSIIWVYGKNCRIKDNIFFIEDYYDGLEYGLEIYYTNNNIIRNNIFYNGEKALNFKAADNNIIQNNQFINNQYGVDIGITLSIDFSRRITKKLYFRKSNYNHFINNTFTNNRHGMIITSSDSNIIINNTFNSNEKNGLLLSMSTNNIINGNIFKNDGLEIWGNKKEDYIHEIKNNTVNEKPIIYLYNEHDKTITDSSGQIIIIDCSRINIEKQRISFTTTALLVAFSQNINIQNNEFSKNYIGVILNFCNKCKITKNNFIKNTIPAYFKCKGILNIKKNTWRRNYWEKKVDFGISKLFPKRIPGQVIPKRMIQDDDIKIGWPTRVFEWVRAKRPYII